MITESKNLAISDPHNVILKKYDTKDYLTGLICSNMIAFKLKISEDEVIKMITCNLIKGKKVNGRYYVREEDFNNFLTK